MIDAPLDIAAIRARAERWEDRGSYTIQLPQTTRDDTRSLCDEVERLRAERTGFVDAIDEMRYAVHNRDRDLESVRAERDAYRAVLMELVATSRRHSYGPVSQAAFILAIESAERLLNEEAGT